jgi:uncharacterized membrane protein
MQKTLKNARKSFLAGLLVILPVAGSIWIIWKLFETFTNLLLLPIWKDDPWTPLYRVIALAVFLLLVTLVGWVTRLMAGKRIIALTEHFIGRVPLFSKIYLFIKEVSNTMLGQRKTVFDRVVLVEYPRPGIYAIGFVTNESVAEIQYRTKEHTINVFVPTTPNPTSGFLLVIPRNQTTNLDMTVADGMKLVISGGAFSPSWTPPRVANAPDPGPVNAARA